MSALGNPMGTTTEAFLSVRNLRVGFGRAGAIRAVRGVSFDVHPGRTLCIVGESGSGKSVTAISVMGLHPRGTAQVTADLLRLGDQDLLACSERDLARLRGPRMSMIFQDPMSSLNPVLTVGYQIREALQLHEKLTRRAAQARALEMLQLVRIPDAASRLETYPHQLSGGMRQRVMIAMALICKPKLLIADEPTTALDVTVQAQILWLLAQLQRDFGTAIVFITHDLGVVAEIADDVAVMYAGQIVESGTVQDIFDRPSHGYTVGLLGATADFDPHGTALRRLVEIPGTVQSVHAAGAGCAFAPRCAFAVPSCHQRQPDARTIGAGHLASCDQAVVSTRGAATAAPHLSAR